MPKTNVSPTRTIDLDDITASLRGAAGFATVMGLQRWEQNVRSIVDIAEQLDKFQLAHIELSSAAVALLEDLDADDEFGPMYPDRAALLERLRVDGWSGDRLQRPNIITVLFGENASGKSGYVRILKALAGTAPEHSVRGRRRPGRRSRHTDR